jgi:hypothetical protein
MLEPIPFAGYVEIDESFDRTASHMAGEYVSYRELTDEEIIAIANGCLVGATAWHNPDLDPIEFARAILRKAQEK